MRAPNAWILHVKKFRKAHPELSYKEALQQANTTYISKTTAVKQRQRQKRQKRSQARSFHWPFAGGPSLKDVFGDNEFLKVYYDPLRQLYGIISMRVQALHRDAARMRTHVKEFQRDMDVTIQELEKKHDRNALRRLLVAQAKALKISPTVQQQPLLEFYNYMRSQLDERTDTGALINLELIKDRFMATDPADYNYNYDAPLQKMFKLAFDEVVPIEIPELT